MDVLLFPLECDCSIYPCRIRLFHSFIIQEYKENHFVIFEISMFVRNPFCFSEVTLLCCLPFPNIVDR